MPYPPVTIGNVHFGNGQFGWIAGPCALESEAVVCAVAERLCQLTEETGEAIVFKGSYDKANRTSANSERGPGLEQGLKLLDKIRTTFGLATITDVHETSEVTPVAEVADAIQIPAFLCRQTSLIQAAAATGKPVMIKRGQFMAPEDICRATEKASGSPVLLAERGSSFGYNDLVVDFRALPVMRSAAPVVFDATHSVQKPGAAGGSSGGAREYLRPLARAALAVGVDGIFVETHPDPERAISDRQTQLPLADFPQFIRDMADLRHRLEGH